MRTRSSEVPSLSNLFGSRFFRLHYHPSVMRVSTVGAAVVLLSLAAATGVAVSQDAPEFDISSIEGEDADSVNEIRMERGETLEIAFDGVDASEHLFYVTVAGVEYTLTPDDDGSLSVRGELPEKGEHTLEVTLVHRGEPATSADTRVYVEEVVEDDVEREVEEVESRVERTPEDDRGFELDDLAVEVEAVNGMSVEEVVVRDYLHNPVEVELEVEGMDEADGVRLYLEYDDRRNRLEGGDGVYAPVSEGTVVDVDEGVREFTLVASHTGDDAVVDEFSIEFRHTDEAYEGEHWEGEGEPPEPGSGSGLLERVSGLFGGDSDDDGDGEESADEPGEGDEAGERGSERGSGEDVSGDEGAGDDEDDDGGSEGAVDRIMDWVFG